MTLSNKEKVLIIILILVTILVGGTVLFVVPQLQQMEKKTIELVEQQLKKADADTRLATIETLDDSLKKAYEDGIKAAKRFLPHMTAQEVDDTLSPFFKSSNVQRDSMTIADATAVPLDAYYYQKGTLDYPLNSLADTQNLLPQNAAVELPAAENVEMTAVTATVTASYEDMKRFLDSIATSGNTIYVKGCSLTDMTAGTVKGTLALEVYAIAKPTEPAASSK